MGMRILITGASGFIGKAVVEAFTAEHEIVELHERQGHGLIADLRDPDAVNRAVREALPDAVIHLAAKTQVAWSFEDYSDVSRVNYDGTVHLAEAVSRFAPAAHFLFASTMETYGRQPQPWEPFTEETPQHPCAPYAVAKVGAERYIEYLAETRGLKFTILRQTNTYGRTEDEFFVVERIISQMLRGKQIRLGSPEPWRNFLHIDDLISLYRRVLFEKPREAQGEIFVTGPRNAIQIPELVELIGSLMGWDGEVEWGTAAPRPGEVWYLNSDPAKAYALLDWQPQISLEEGLQRTIEAWRHIV